MDSNGEQKKKGKMSARKKWKKNLKRKMLRQSIARGEIPNKCVTNNEPTISNNNKRTIKQMDRIQRKEEKEKFNRERLTLLKIHNRRKKKLLELQSVQQKDFVDYEGMIKLQEKIYAYEKEELKRKKVIYEVEMQLQRTAILNVPISLLLVQEGNLRKLIEANEKKNEEFYKSIFEEKSRILRRTELSRARRLELEEKAWENDKRDAALQRAEERAKTAELMVLLEEVCGHPAEETLQPEDNDGLEDILSSEDECVMKDIKLELFE